MPYATGTANDIPALLTALRNFLTSNGWTLSGNVLHKGDCHAEVMAVNYPVSGVAGGANDTHLRVRMGNGIDGSNALTDPSPMPSYLGLLRQASGGPLEAWAFPVTYHLHAHAVPDEVWLFVNYSATNAGCWQSLGFGASPDPGNAGTGCWQFAPIGNPTPSDHINYLPMYSWHRGNLDGGSWYLSQGGMFTAMPFWVRESGTNSFRSPSNSYVHGVIDSVTEGPVWSPAQINWRLNSTENLTAAYLPMQPLFEYSLNTWNLEATLVRIRIMEARPSAKTSIIATMQHARMCRNDYLADGEVVDLGPDRWKVYPCYRKNVASRDGGATQGTSIDHSGTFALAIRYDGP